MRKYQSNGIMNSQIIDLADYFQIISMSVFCVQLHLN